MRFALALFLSFFLLQQGIVAQDNPCTNFTFDHLVFFVDDPSIEEQLNTILTPGEKLITKHKNQGTLSHFYLFHNTFIEFIYPQDISKIKANTASFGSDYLKRWSAYEPVCQLAVGLILEPFDLNCSNLHAYQSKDSPGGYLMSLANTDQTDVLLYSSPPDKAYQKIEKLEDLKDIFEPPYLADFQEYCSHPTGIRNLTGLFVEGPDITDKANFKQLLAFDLIETQNAPAFKYVLEFDEQRQGEELQVTPWLVLRY